MNPSFKTSSLCFSLYILATGVSIFQLRVKNSSGTQQTWRLAFVHVGIFWESQYSSPAKQNRSNSATQRGRPPPFGSVALKATQLNRREAPDFSPTAATKRGWCSLGGSGRSSFPAPCFSRTPESPPSFQDKNNHLLCAVAMAFVALQKCALVCLWGLTCISTLVERIHQLLLKRNNEMRFTSCWLVAPFWHIVTHSDSGGHYHGLLLSLL